MLTNKNNSCAVAFVTLGDTGDTPSFHRMMTRFDSYANECISLFVVRITFVYPTGCNTTVGHGVS